jgi:hypothetical protein
MYLAKGEGANRYRFAGEGVALQAAG